MMKKKTKKNSFDFYGCLQLKGGCILYLIWYLIILNKSSILLPCVGLQT